MAHESDIFNKILCFKKTISPHFTHGMPVKRCVYAIDDDDGDDVLFPLHIYPFTSRLDWLGSLGVYLVWLHNNIFFINDTVHTIFSVTMFS